VRTTARDGIASCGERSIRRRQLGRGETKLRCVRLECFLVYIGPLPARLEVPGAVLPPVAVLRGVVFVPLGVEGPSLRRLTCLVRAMEMLLNVEGEMSRKMRFRAWRPIAVREAESWNGRGSIERV
jgi:hypothetical protein